MVRCCLERMWPSAAVERSWTSAEDTTRSTLMRVSAACRLDNWGALHWLVHGWRNRSMARWHDDRMASRGEEEGVPGRATPIRPIL